MISSMASLEQKSSPSTRLFFETKDLKLRKKVVEMSFNCTGEKLAVCSEEEKIIIYCFGKNGLEREKEIRENAGLYPSVAFHPLEPFTLLATTFSKSIRLWEVASKHSLLNHEMSSGSNLKALWQPTGHHFLLYSESASRTCFVYEYVSASKEMKLKKEKTLDQEPHVYIFDESGRYILAGGLEKGSVMAYDLDFNVLFSHEFHSVSCLDLALDPTKRFFASAGGDAVICLINTVELICEKSISEVHSSATKVGFSFDGKFLIALHEDSFLRIFDVETGSPFSVLCSFEK